MGFQVASITMTSPLHPLEGKGHPQLHQAGQGAWKMLFMFTRLIPPDSTRLALPAWAGWGPGWGELPAARHHLGAWQ